MGGVREGLYRCNDLSHLIKLWSGYWFKHTTKMNKAVGENNNLDNYGGRKRLVCHFIKTNFWKCIGCILLSVKYGIEIHQLRGKSKTSIGKKGKTTIKRYV